MEIDNHNILKVASSAKVFLITNIAILDNLKVHKVVNKISRCNFVAINQTKALIKVNPGK